MSTSGVVGMHFGRSGRRGWSPGWALAVAVIGAVLALVPVWYGAGVLLAVRSELHPSGAAMGTAIGQVTLAAGLVTLAILVRFLVRGGRVGFLIGMALVALGLAYAALTF